MNKGVPGLAQADRPSRRPTHTVRAVGPDTTWLDALWWGSALPVVSLRTLGLSRELGVLPSPSHAPSVPGPKGGGVAQTRTICAGVLGAPALCTGSTPGIQLLLWGLQPSKGTRPDKASGMRTSSPGCPGSRRQGPAAQVHNTEARLTLSHHWLSHIGEHPWGTSCPTGPRSCCPHTLDGQWQPRWHGPPQTPGKLVSSLPQALTNLMGAWLQDSDRAAGTQTEDEPAGGRAVAPLPTSSWTHGPTHSAKATPVGHTPACSSCQCALG